MYRTMRQLDACIGEEATDVILSQALETSFQAYKKGQQEIQAQLVEQQNVS